MKNQLRYRNIGAKTKIQSKIPPKFVHKKFRDEYKHDTLRVDKIIRKQIEIETKRIGGKQPKRFSKWLIFLLRLLKLDKE